MLVNTLIQKKLEEWQDSQLAVSAAATALEDARIDFNNENLERFGVVMGNGNGGLPTTEENAEILFSRGGMKISPFFVPMILPNMAAAQISRIFGLGLFIYRDYCLCR